MPNRGSTQTGSAAIAGSLLAALVFTADVALANTDSPPADAQEKPKLVDLWQPGDPGERMNIRGRVTSLDGTPLGGIEIEIRQPNGDGEWSERYRTTITTDAKGRYQFGSVVPVSNYCGDPHVEVVVYQNGWTYFDDKLVFQEDFSADNLYYGDGTPVFLEESSVKGETIKYGRFDITLSPE